MSVTAGLPYDDVIPPSEAELDVMLARVKGRVFLYPGAGFLGSLLCDHRYIWDETCRTAWCNGQTIGWNPKFFFWLTPEERICGTQATSTMIRRVSLANVLTT